MNTDTITDLQDKLALTQDALARANERVQALSVAMDASDNARARARTNLYEARLDLAMLDARKQFEAGAELAREIARKQAAISKLEKALAEQADDPREKEWAEACALADALEHDVRTLDAALGAAHGARIASELAAHESKINALRAEIAEHEQECAHVQAQAPALLAHWPELAARYVKKPAAPVFKPREPEPVQRVLAAFDTWTSALIEAAPHAPAVLNGVNLSTIFGITSEEIAAAFGSGAYPGGAYTGGLVSKRARARGLADR